MTLHAGLAGQRSAKVAGEGLSLDGFEPVLGTVRGPATEAAGQRALKPVPGLAAAALGTLQGVLRKAARDNQLLETASARPRQADPQPLAAAEDVLSASVKDCEEGDLLNEAGPAPIGTSAGRRAVKPVPGLAAAALGTLQGVLHKAARDNQRLETASARPHQADPPSSAATESLPAASVKVECEEGDMPAVAPAGTPTGRRAVKPVAGMAAAALGTLQGVLHKAARDNQRLETASARPHQADPPSSAAAQTGRVALVVDPSQALKADSKSTGKAQGDSVLSADAVHNRLKPSEEGLAGTRRADSNRTGEAGVDSDHGAAAGPGPGSMNHSGDASAAAGHESLGSSDENPGSRRARNKPYVPPGRR